MNTNTGGNTAPESNENIKKDTGNTLSQLYKDFSEHIVKDLSPEDTNKEIENFITADSLSSSQLKYLEVFKGKYEKYDGIKVKEIELPGLKRELRSQFLKRKGLFQSVKKQILKKYNITSNQYSDFNIEGFIKSKNLNELTEIYSTSQKMDKFISNFCENKKIKVFEKKSVKNIFKDISLKERYKDKMKDLSEEDITEISQSMTYLKQNIGQTDFGLQFSLHIDTLLSKKILNYTEVSDIIKEFIPFISLADALKINSNLDDKAIKKAQLNSLNDLNFDSLNSDTQDKIIKEINDKDISIPVEYLFSTDKAIVKELVDKLINESFLIKIGDAIQEELSDFENIGGPQNYNSFIKGLKDQKTNVINPEKFITGNYIVLKTTTKNQGSDEKKEKNSYFKILSDGSDKPFGNIILESKGEEKYSSSNSKNATFTYKDWIDFIEKGNSEKNILVDSHGIYSEKEFKEKINNGNVLEDLETSEFKNPPSDLDAYKNNKENDKIKELLNKKPEYSKLKDKQLREKIYEVYPDFENEIDNEIIDWNRNYLITKLKEIDDSGDKFGFERGTTISYEDGSETIYFTVENAENYNISIKHDNKNSEKMDYNTFYNAFKDKHAKRVNKVNNCTKLLDNIGEIESIKDKWSGVEISNSGNFIKKNTSDDEGSVLDYEYIECELPLFGECDVMKIHNISDNGVKVSYGKKTGHEKLKDKKAQEEKEEREKKEGKKILYNMGSDTQTIPLGVFQAYLEKKGGIPKSFEEENSPEIHNDPDSVKREGSFLSRFMQRSSINDLIAGGKLVIDSIESKLKEGTDEQAAKMVSDLNWLPDSIKIDLDMRVEQASKKRMDEFKDRLGGMDSGKSTEMISKVLLNKDSPESMKEASIMFMAEKYGTLYEKSALHKYKGSFLRYEAFGGRIGDELYRRVEADCKSDGVNFTEHELMIGLLGNQCKGRLKPKRRSKLHKEYKAAMARGKKDEKEKGANDSNEKRTFEGRLYGVALNELKDGAYLNAIGALGPVIGKGDGGKFERLDMMPFVMMSSGDAYTYDQDVSNMIKGSFSPAGMALPSTFFCSSPDLIDLYNNTLLEATKILEADNPGKYSDMLNMVTTLLSGNKVVNNDALKTKKIDQAIELYKKYGDEISRIMNMLNTRKNDDVAKYEKLIWLEKDNNKVFKDYFNLFNSVAVGAECDFSKDDDTMADAFYSNEPGTGGYTGMGSKKVFRDTLAENTNGTYRMSKAGPQTEGELINQLEAFKKIDYDYGSASVDEIKIRKIAAVTDYLHGYFYAMKYHHNIVKHFPDIIKTKVPMKMLGVNPKDFENLTAMDFEKDKPEALAVSKKYAKIWLGIGNIQNDDSDIFENIPRSVSDILD